MPRQFKENKHPRDLGKNKIQSKPIKVQTKKEDIDKKTLNIKAKEIWDNYTDEQKRNVYSTYTGIHPKDVDIGGMEYSLLPKYVKMSLQDDAVEAAEKPKQAKPNTTLHMKPKNAEHKYSKNII